MKRIFCFCLGLSLFVVAGCAGSKTVDTDVSSPESLYQSGYTAFQETDYPKAVEMFNEVERQYPYSVWSERAQIMSAYASYRQNEYDEALLTLERFIQLHPGNKNTPYAYYLKGLCYFEQVSDASREQSMTEKALDVFNELIARYPDTVYATDAQSKLGELVDHLAAQEMEIGRYYLKNEDIIPALNRFKDVIEQYGNTNQVPEAYYRMTVCYVMLGMTQAADQTKKELVKKYEGNPWTVRAKKLMKK